MSSSKNKSPAAKAKEESAPEDISIASIDDVEEGQKFLSTEVATDLEVFKTFECSERSQRVDLIQIRDHTIAALGDKDLGISLAIKFNLHGHKIKEGDFIKIKGTTYLIKDLLVKISTWQMTNGFTATVLGPDGLSRDSDKKMVCVSRIARAFAKTVSGLIHKGAIKVPPELRVLAKGTGLPDHFCFLEACYGMSDEELLIHKDAFKVFCTNFTASVSKSYKSGRMPSTTMIARDHAEEFENYVTWRGVELG